jgi:hypothetical protein
MLRKHKEINDLVALFQSTNSTVSYNYSSIKKFVLTGFVPSLLHYDDYNSFTDVFFNKDKENKIYLAGLLSNKPKYNKEFQETIDTLNEKYDKSKLLPFFDNKLTIPITNITPAEKSVYGITNDTIYIGFNLKFTTKFYDSHCNFLNKYDPLVSKQLFPKINPRGLVERNNRYFLDEIFFINHVDELSKAADLYKKLNEKTIQNHIDFMKYADKMINKYIVLTKL